MSLRGYKKKGKPALWTELESKRKKSPNPKRLYTLRAKEVIKEANQRGERCPAVALIPELREGRKYGHPISDRITEVHHKFGRVGRLLLWEPGWILMSKQGHRWVHQNPERARALGFLAPVGCFNDFERAKRFLEDLSK